MAGGPPKTRVLVVDDEDDMRILITICLEGFDRYEVKTVSGVAEALAALERNTPDILVTDVMMPGVSGIDLVEIIRRRVQTADLPVVFFTCLSPNEVLSNLGPVENCVVLTKPASPARLDDAITQLIAHSPVA